MALRDIFLNALGAAPEAQKTENSVFKSARDFLVNGSRDRLYPSWADIKMSDSDMYRGYSYAVIQKRGNKVATLAKNNLKTTANPDVVDEYQKKNLDVLHPYLKLIEDSTNFTEKQFWKNISIYLDLAGRYYLGVIRSEVKPLNPNLPTITTDPTEFVMLNPYEIRRVIDKNKNIAGYIERKKDGRYREWPAYQIIEMRELNPFDPENSQWAMTDAAKNAVYTINQSGDYTRQSLNGNIDAPGIITTDVLLNDEDFANFRARVAQHKKGEPLFGNGTGAIKWDSMQIDLDKAALMDINEINRTELFAVSGTSKTSLGIEQSGTTRETARVQSEQFVSDTAQPRLEDIVDFLNLDYKRHYKLEYQKTGYYIEVESAVGKDYDTEQKAIQLKQTQFALAQQLIQSGYTVQSAYQFAEGDIDFKDLELEKGLDRPKNPDQPEQPDENSPTSPQNGPTSDSGSGNDKSIVSEDEGGSNENLEDLNGLEPHNDLVENGGKGSGNFGHSGRPGEVGGSGKGDYYKDLFDSAKADMMHAAEKYDKAIEDGDQSAIQEADAERVRTEEFYDKLKKEMKEEGVSKSVLKEIEKTLQPPHDRYTREVTEARYNPEQDRYEAEVTVHFKDKTPDEKESWWTKPGKDPKDKMSWFQDNSPTYWEELADRIDRAHGGGHKNSVEGEERLPLATPHCTCEHDHKIETFINEVKEDEGKIVDKAYKDFLQEVRDIEKETIDASVRKVTVNSFEISDIIGERKRKKLTEKLRNALHRYWWLIFPLFANSSMDKRNLEFSEDVDFVFNNALQKGVDDNALRVAEGHMETILNDILEASNRALTNVTEEAAAELIIKAYKVTPDKFGDYFDHEPTMADALSSIRRTDILEQNRKIYEKANQMAFEGYDRRTIIKAIRDEYKDISENRATLIARNETSRAFTRSQFEADKQFLNGIGKLDQAYKVWYSRRPLNEQDKICDFCNEMIRMSEENPIPFDEPFLAYGDSLEVIQDNGKVGIFTANYEDIEGGCLHPNCQCGYHLVFKNDAGEFVKTLNEGPDDKTTNGGKGSGNFGHEGRPGEIGGSGKGGEHKHPAAVFDELQKLTNWTKYEAQSVFPYFGNFENTRRVQEYLRGGDDVSISNVAMASDCVIEFDRKMERTTFPEDVTLYRGMVIDKYKLERAIQNGFSSSGYQSTSLVEGCAINILNEYMNQDSYSPEFKVPILLKINAKKGQHFAAAPTSGEFEIVLPRDIEFKIKNKTEVQGAFTVYEVEYE